MAQRTCYLQLQKYCSRIAPVSHIEQPLTQVHFVPPNYFLVSIGDVTNGQLNVFI
jgi:hypothetical protein